MGKKPSYEELEQRVKELELAEFEKKRVEEALWESEGRYRSLFKNNHSVMLVIDPKNGEIADANPAACSFYGWSLEELTAKKITDINILTKEQVFQEMERAKSEQRQHFIFRHRLSNGDIRDVEVYSGPIKLHEQQYLYSIIHDITDRKHAEEALQKSEHLLNDVIESIQDGISVLNTDLTISRVNNVMKKWYAKNLPLEGKKCHVCYHYSDEPCDPCPTIRCIKSGQTEREIVPGLPGSPIKWIELFSYPIIDQGSGAVSSVVEFVRDITERKQVEEVLQKSEEKFRTIFISAPVGIAIANPEGRFIEVNDSGCRMLGYSKEELIEMSFLDITYPNDLSETQKLAANVWDGKSDFYQAEKRYLKKDGSPLWATINASAIRDRGGKVQYWIGIMEDISQRKQAEDALKNSLKVKQMLLREIHHRVKNNLEIISSLIDLGSMNTDNREKQKLLSDVSSRINSMALIHNQLYESDRFDKVDMKRHVQEMVDNILIIYGNGEKLINFVIEASEMYLSVEQAIPSALALNEIITNSFKHAFRENKQGTINICINNPTDDTVFMRVKDDGVGISKGIDFNNTKGIGLKLVKHLIEDQLKGEICVNREDGTEICLEFKRLKL